MQFCKEEENIYIGKHTYLYTYLYIYIHTFGRGGGRTCSEKQRVVIPPFQICLVSVSHQDHSTSSHLFPFKIQCSSGWTIRLSQ